MNRLITIFCVFSGLSLPVIADEFDTDKIATSLQVYVGQKYLEESDWAPLEQQTAIGFGIDIGTNQSPFRFHLSYLKAESDSEAIPVYRSVIVINGETSELRIGGKYLIASNSDVTPYFGGGFAFMSSTTSSSSTVIEGEGLGAWLSAGLRWDINNTFNLGLETSYSLAEIDVGESDIESDEFAIEVGGLHIGITGGISF